MTYYATSSGHLSRHATCLLVATNLFLSQQVSSYFYKIQTFPNIAPWFSRSCFTKSDDKLPKVLLLKYRTYNRGATAQTLSAGGPGLIAPGGTPGKIKWPELGVTKLRFGDRLDPADSD